MKTIQIKCKGASELELDEFEIFQGDLKKITKENMKRLKNNILTQGFIAPIFVYEDTMIFKILDGTHRIKALKELRSEGYEIPKIPIVFIDADNEADARKKLLSITSQFAEFDTEELTKWIDEIDDNIRESLRFTNDEIELFNNVEEEEFPELKTGDKDPIQQITFTLSDEQAENVKAAIKKAQSEGLPEDEFNKNKNGCALSVICEVFLNG